MNEVDIFLLLLIAAAVVLAICRIHKDRKAGKGCLGCEGNCAGCATGCCRSAGDASGCGEGAGDCRWRDGRGA